LAGLPGHGVVPAGMLDVLGGGVPGAAGAGAPGAAGAVGAPGSFNMLDLVRASIGLDLGSAVLSDGVSTEV
jgi:hypothetical protein